MYEIRAQKGKDGSVYTIHDFLTSKQEGERLLTERYSKQFSDEWTLTLVEV